MKGDISEHSYLKKEYLKPHYCNYVLVITKIPYTKSRRECIYKQPQPDIQREVSLLMKSNLLARSVEYMDNRISRYSMKMGKCEITDVFLYASDVHCHHFTPLHLGGTINLTIYAFSIKMYIG